MQQTNKTVGNARTLNLATVLAAVLAASSAHALINPRFTPIHLVKEATLIAEMDLKAGSNSVFTATIRETIKGKTEQKTLRLDASRADEDSCNALRDLAAAGQPALLFEGEFRDQPNADAFRSAYLSVGGKWARCDTGKGGWVLTKLGDRELAAVWAGGTDMLRRAVDYILADDDPAVPVNERVSWSNPPVKLTAMSGAIRAIRTVELGGDGKLALFVACDGGDRLLEVAKTRSATDITAARGLQSKSRAFAWGDFAGQGRLDLISFDGKAATLHAQQADGKFQAKPLDLGTAMSAGCIGLATLDAGNGRAGLVVTGEAFPVVVTLDAEGKASATTLTAPGVEWAKLGKLGPGLVADFDGDGYADILLPAEEGSVFFRATAPGKFAPGVACDLKQGKAPATACLGDFDADGRLDVFCVNASGSLLWDNVGGGKFKETFDLTGELAYGAGLRGSDCMAGDFNNDGRQDLAIAYSAGQPMLFFNRGFRTFGNATGINLGWDKLLPEAEKGQASACLADLDGDGAQDLGLALKNGEIWTVFRENSNADCAAMMALATLAVGGPNKGPIAVTGWNGKRCLGAWNVQPGVGQACLGTTEAGAITLKWRLPGGQEQTKEVVLEKGGTLKVEIK
jgi:hypothetical protein